MCGVEFVSDTAAKTPASPNVLKAAFEATYEAGAMVRVGGNNLLMSPPLVIEEAEIETLLSALEIGVQAAANA